MKNAVMIVLEKDGRFLLGKRSLTKVKAPGYWCPISGHVERGESEHEAVIREAKEELNVTVIPLKKVGSSLTCDGTVMLHWWTVKLEEGVPEINNKENSELRWFSKPELRELSPVFKEDMEILLNL